MTILTSMPADQYYFLNNTIFIKAEHPEAPELIKKCPTVPAVNGPALELFLEVLHGKVTAEAKVELLKQAVQAL